MLILPAIDLIDGRCVRLLHGDYNQKTVYDADPVLTAKSFVDQGATWLHLVDLDAAKGKGENNFSVISQIAAQVNIRIELGGGIRSADRIQQAMDCGVSRVVLGTAAVSDPAFAEVAFAQWGDRVVLGIDTKDGLVAVQGWTETSALDGVSFAKDMVSRGCPRIIYTDIATDGAFTGPNIPALRQMIEGVNVPIIASGGVSSLNDLIELAKLPGLEGAIVGRALYEGRLDLGAAIREISE